MADVTHESLIDEVIRSDFGFRPWFETYGRIITKGGEMAGGLDNPITINYLQEKFCEAVEWCLVNGVPIRFLLLKPRQKGSSTISVAFLYWLCMIKRTSAIIMGGQSSQTLNLWSLLNHYSTHDSFRWGFDHMVKAMGCDFGNGSKINKETAGDREASRSATLQCVLATEAARWPETTNHSSSAVLTGVMNGVPFLPYTAVILESTASGPEGAFYSRWTTQSLPFDEFKERYEAGESVDGLFIQIFAPAHAFDDSRSVLTDFQKAETVDSYTTAEKSMVAEFGVDPEYVAWYRRTLKASCENNLEQMHQDFPMTPGEAFSASSRVRFNKEGLKRLRQEALGSPPDEGRLDGDLDGDRFVFMPVDSTEEQPIYWRYEPPIEGLRYIMAVDTMTGASNVKGGDPDNHCAMVIRTGYYHQYKGWMPPKVVCRTISPCRWDADVLDGVVWALACYYGKCMIVPEMAAMGAELIRLLRERNANIYQAMTADENADRIRSKASGHYGFRTTSKSRPTVIESLASAIASFDEQGGGLSCPDLDTVKELESFIVNNNGRPEAAAGKHDDAVMTLGIALVTASAATLYSKESLRPEPPPDIKKFEAMYKADARRSNQFS